MAREHHDFFKTSHRDKYLIHVCARELHGALESIAQTHGKAGLVKLYKAGEDGVFVVGFCRNKGEEDSLIVESIGYGEGVEAWPFKQIFALGSECITVRAADAVTLLNEISEDIRLSDDEARESFREDDDDDDDDELDPTDRPNLTIQLGVEENGEAFSYALYDDRSCSYRMGRIPIDKTAHGRHRLSDIPMRKMVEAEPISAFDLMESIGEALYLNKYLGISPTALKIKPQTTLLKERGPIGETDGVYRSAQIRAALSALYTQADEPIRMALVWMDRLPFLALRGHSRCGVKGSATLFLIPGVDWAMVPRRTRIRHSERD